MVKNTEKPLDQYEIDFMKFTNTLNNKNSELNQQMANYADALIVFWDGKSRGTKNMIELAKTANLKIRVFKY